MVTAVIEFWLAPACLLAAAVDANESVLEQLEPERRAAVVMALLAITVLGIFLVTTILLGGNWVRRLARYRRGPTKLPPDAGNQRLRKALEPILPEGNRSDETTVIKRGTDETTVDP